MNPKSRAAKCHSWNMATRRWKSFRRPRRKSSRKYSKCLSLKSLRFFHQQKVAMQMVVLKRSFERQERLEDGLLRVCGRLASAPNWNLSKKFCRWEANIVRQKFNFIQRINGQENLAIPGNSWVNNWEKKSGHDTHDGSHATWEGNTLVGYTREARTWTAVED